MFENVFVMFVSVIYLFIFILSFCLLAKICPHSLKKKFFASLLNVDCFLNKTLF